MLVVLFAAVVPRSFVVVVVGIGVSKLKKNTILVHIPRPLYINIPRPLCLPQRAVLALRQRHDDPDRDAKAAGDAAARVLPDARRVAEVSKLPELGHRAVASHARPPPSRATR